jgi:hypothetical protein
VKRLGLSLVVACSLVLATAALAADPRAAKEKLTAADNALAKRAVIARSWLDPGWTQTTSAGDTSEAYTCSGHNPDLSAFTITGKAQSAFKHRTAAEVHSEIAVFKARAQAVADFRLGVRPGVARCLRAALLREYRKFRDPKLYLTISARKTVPPRIGEQSGGFRLVLALKRVSHPAATALTVYMDVLVVQKGRSVALVTFSALEKPFPGQAPLAGEMAARMA